MLSNICRNNNSTSTLLDILKNFTEIKNNTDLAKLNENYISKTRNLRYIPVIEQYFQYDIFETIENSSVNTNYEFLLQNLNTINKKVIFNSPVHGISHNEKVMMLSYIIACEEKIADTDFQILFDAAKYHDIGRVHDDEDEKHGFESSQKIKDLIQYNNIEDNQILKFIIEAHSVDDEKNSVVLSKYKINNIKRGEKLSSILKDADALDRVRFARDKNSTWSDLNPSYLRTETAKKLIKFSHQLDQLYIWNSNIQFIDDKNMCS